MDALITNNYEVAAIDNLSTGHLENLHPDAEFEMVDILDAVGLHRIFARERPDYVIHHAAQISVTQSTKDPFGDAQTNILGTLNVLECCREFNVKRVVYATSAAIYGSPRYLPVDEEHPACAHSHYGISKHTVQHYLEVYEAMYGLEYTSLCYANVYGPRQDATGEGGVIGIFIDRLLDGRQPFIYGNGEQTRDFVYVKDVAGANLLALESTGSHFVNISSNQSISINSLYHIINMLLGREIDPIYRQERPGDIRHSRMDNSRAKEILGWSPRISLVEGLKKTIGYFVAKKNTELKSVKVTSQLVSPRLALNSK